MSVTYWFLSRGIPSRLWSRTEELVRMLWSQRVAVFTDNTTQRLATRTRTPRPPTSHSLNTISLFVKCQPNRIGFWKSRPLPNAEKHFGFKIDFTCLFIFAFLLISSAWAGAALTFIDSPGCRPASGGGREVRCRAVPQTERSTTVCFQRPLIPALTLKKKQDKTPVSALSVWTTRTARGTDRPVLNDNQTENLAKVLPTPSLARNGKNPSFVVIC